ncbi:Cell division protein FtsN OS=Eoetvoesiella caeni OX=645616 GN=DFR37_102516 PE=4 SV=1 [Eoetvoesiella caeni]
MFGLLAGLIIGLAAAAGVAYYVTQAPMPFVDKASREKSSTLPPANVDPNLALNGKDDPGVTPVPDGPLAGAPRPIQPGGAPGEPPASLNDEIGALLVTLGAPEPSAKGSAPAPAKPGATPAAPAADSGKKPASAPKPTEAKPASTQTTYYLQAGAFRSNSDAEAVKAQILLLGLPAQVQKAQINGSTINRVRVGPFKGIDEMNRSRARLATAKIESSVVRP